VPPSAVTLEITTCAPAERPKGASVHAVTVVEEAVVLGQPGTVAGAATGPSTMSLTVTIVAMLGAKPTAPFHENPVAGAGGQTVYGEAPLVAPSVVAGSPGSNGVLQVELVAQPSHGLLKIYGNWVDGRPAATSAKPESGPNENMKICVPSPIVERPSPPEICWHLMAPFTTLGTTAAVCAVPGVARLENCVGPLYAGSVLLHPALRGVVTQSLPVNGCVMVPAGHCTRKDWAAAGSAAAKISAARKHGAPTFLTMPVNSIVEQIEFGFLMTMQPPP